MIWKNDYDSKPCCGTVVQASPAGCKAVTVGGKEYQECGGSFYKAAFQGNNLVYVVVENPT